jgi:hypothetical protein
LSGRSPADSSVNQAELLSYLADVLESLGVDYMIGGSQASPYYGEPRLTRDIDVVVDLRPQHLPALLARFPAEEFYLDEETAREAIRMTRQAAATLWSGGILRASRGRHPLQAALLPAGRLGLHLRDVLGILRVSGPELDEEYIAEWAGHLGLRTIWEQIRKQTEG